MKKTLVLASLVLASMSFNVWCQEWKPGNRDWVNLPEVKRTKLALYLTPQEALEMKETQGNKVLFLDIRTRAEAMFVGMAGKVDALVPYMELPDMMADWDDKRSTYAVEPNPDFTKDVARRLAEKGLDKNAPIILMCRSGDRSARAADLLQMAGYTKVYSVVEGFEGDQAKEGPKAGQRVVNGWKNAGLAWSYKLDKTKAYFSTR